MNIAILVGRIIVGIFYLYNGINHFIKFGAMTEYAKFKGVPLAEVAVAVSGLFLLAAALTIILGIFPESCLLLSRNSTCLFYLIRSKALMIQPA